MKKLLPGRNHTSILTYSLNKIAALAIFISLMFISPNNVSAAACCPSGWSTTISSLVCCPNGFTLNTNSGECRKSGEDSIASSRTTCSDTESCSNNQCVAIDPGIGCTAAGSFGCNIAQPEECNTAQGLYCCSSPLTCENLIENPQNVVARRPENTICSYTDNSAECTACLGDGGDGGGVWTALGCIHYGQDAFTLELVKIIIGIASLVSLAMMLIGAVLYMTGGGNTEQLKRGKELFTGALIGLLFLVFSVVILQIITRDIIKIDIGM